MLTGAARTQSNAHMGCHHLQVKNYPSKPSHWPLTPNFKNFFNLFTYLRDRMTVRLSVHSPLKCLQHIMARLKLVTITQFRSPMCVAGTHLLESSLTCP